jgi:hypothetical protein
VSGLAEAAAELEASPLGVFVRETAWAYPAANVAHLLGLVMLVGAIGVVDLRVVGFWRALPLPALSRALTPVALIGLAVMVVSGPLLFAADARALVGSSVLGWKLALVGLALVNALLFRRLWPERRLGEAAPLLARVAAAASIGLWLWIGALGRWIAYA